ncbi:MULTISPECIES: dTMP kinase [Helicobacter]|uniref:Thymidylate kinase n=1 Tax=Helicobacter ibis TaxID=2962633 RepID=A0ABT4VBR7_9HELI|nr:MULTISPECIES: dTMP kinase [Helicobacter]MDA3966919.1 dTMP kinase [Helicobacter sp. WB40]MDA3968145.1 dTMP kinase [Helicobacter ibis]
MYIALEGIDTCGKSTQIKSLKLHYKDAIFTKEPGGSKIGEKLREILLYDCESLSKEAEILLFLADRAQHIKEIIKPNKEKLIISDRSLVSGIAYATDFDFEILQTLNLFATSGVVPDYVVFLEISENELITRLGKKEMDNIEKRGVEYLLSLQSRILDTIRLLGIPYCIINASDEVGAITNEIISFIDSK